MVQTVPSGENSVESMGPFLLGCWYLGEVPCRSSFKHILCLCMYVNFNTPPNG